MYRHIGVLCLVLVSAPLPGRAQPASNDDGSFTNWPSRQQPVKLEMNGGKTLTGTLVLTEVALHGDVGLYHVRPDRVKTIAFADEQGEPVTAAPYFNGMKGTVTTASGEEIVGTVFVNRWILRTEF